MATVDKRFGATGEDANFWVRWTGSPNCDFALASPWWCSGWDGRDRPIFVAAVRAPSGEAAMKKIKTAHTRGATMIEWSFVNLRPDDWSPFGDRFPRADWMVWP